MAFRMSVFDLLHRAVLFGLVGMGAGGLMLGFQVHRDVLRRGKGKVFIFLITQVLFLHYFSFELAEEMEVQKKTALRDGKEVEDEKALANAAQAILRSRNPPPS